MSIRIRSIASEIKFLFFNNLREKKEMRNLDKMKILKYEIL